MNYYSMMKKYRQNSLTALQDFLAIPSVYDEKSKTDALPYGKDVGEALEYVASLGERFGFIVDRCDGYCTELTIGEGKKLIGIYAHADVVPATGDWTHKPFEPTLLGNKLFARGTSDDKGPLIAAFYAVKALKDNGLIKDYRVRIVVGGDEERGSSCLEHYFHVLKKEPATYGFTPDSDFPLIYGEKGIIDFFSVVDVKLPVGMSIKGGIVTNAVCDKLRVTMKKDNSFIVYLTSQNIDFVSEEVEGKTVLTFNGKAVHGSTPALGKNAALIAMKAIGEFYKLPHLVEIATKLADTTGKSFDGFGSSKLLKETTYCVGMIEGEGKKLRFSVNFRFPENVDYKKYIAHFDEVFGTISTYGEVSPFLLFDPKCKMVRALLKAYRTETGDLSAPLTTGGGTYAKHAPNTVAFGALFPFVESTMHEPDEYINLKDFYMTQAIYAHAIYLLGNLDEN